MPIDAGVRMFGRGSYGAPALRPPVGVQSSAPAPDTCMALGKLFQPSSLILFLKRREQNNAYLKTVCVHIHVEGSSAHIDLC